MNLPLGARLWIADAPKDPKGMILICPGGGYQWLSPREAQPVARAFAAAGWAAAVVYYTVREKPGQPPLGTLPVRQLGEALQTMQQRFPALSALVCGFSAGGHLAASLGVHWRELGLPRPDGMILGYPVITAGKYAHRGSIQNLAGSDDPGWYSLETQVTADTPPAFFWHTVTDPEVPVQNSLLLAGALSAAGVRYEMHLYPRGVHGLSLATPEVDEPEKHRVADPHIAGWFGQCLEWLDILKTTKEGFPMAMWKDDDEMFALMKEKLYTPVVGDILDQMGYKHQFLPASIRPLAAQVPTAPYILPGEEEDKRLKVAGYACTVLENDVFEYPAEKPFGYMTEALDDLKPNEIYIATGAHNSALWGELLTACGKARGAVGAVLDGYTRDTPKVIEQNFPVFCSGTWAQDSSVRTYVFKWRCPIEIGQVTIHNGDIVFGDIDGVLIIPKDIAPEVIEKALVKASTEKTMRKAIEDGMMVTDAFAKFGVL